MMHVSVITPIYNAEPYLEQCLESLAAQTLDGIEFICINDGSTDSSLAILQSFAEHDARFRIIDKPNAGYGHTMNLGIELANGEYVGFLDPDDFAEPDTFSVLFEAAQKFGFPDIVKANHFGYSSSAGDQFVENYSRKMCERLLTVNGIPGIQVLQSIPAIWAAIYRKDFLDEHDLRLTVSPGVAYQDTAFVLKAWIAAEPFYILHDAFVHYRIDNPNSSVKASGNVFRVCEEFDLIDEFLNDSKNAELLLPHVVLKRFTTYEWNCMRLQGEERERFVARASADFAVIRENDLLREELFGEKLWSLVNLLIDRPYEYCALKTYGPKLDAAKREADSLRKQLDESTQKLDACTQQLEKWAERIRVLKTRLAEQKKRAERYKTKAKERDETLRRLKDSNSYKLGRAATWLPRQIKNGAKKRVSRKAL